MANEPKTNLKSLSTRIDVDDYARLVQYLDLNKEEFKDLSSLVRSIVNSFVKDIDLDAKHEELRNSIVVSNIHRRNAKRSLVHRFRDSVRNFLKGRHGNSR